jgi:hypothetical protein
LSGGDADRCIYSFFTSPHALVGSHIFVIFARRAVPVKAGGFSSKIRREVARNKIAKSRNNSAGRSLVPRCGCNAATTPYDEWSSTMNRTGISLIVAAAFASSLFAGSVSAQNYPPPGNVNPGSLNSGAEESGAENQPRSFEPNSGLRSNYFGGYGAYATPQDSTVNVPALGYAPSDRAMPRGAPIYGADE